MAEPSTYIKLDRNITRWRWYQNANTMRVFVHLLLEANIADHDFLNITIHRGEVATSMQKLSEILGISYKQVRTALDNLKKGQEVAITRHSKFIVVTVLNYDIYQGQGNEKAIIRQSEGNEWAIKGQQLKNIKNIKKEKNIKKKGGYAAGFSWDSFAEILAEEDEGGETE